MKRKQIIYMTTSAYNYMLKKVASHPAEQGGALLMKNGIVVRFIHDKNAQTTGTSYKVDNNFLNPLIKKYKKEEGATFCGMLHSHPKGVRYLSGPDQDYFKNTLECFSSLEKLIVPIVYSATDGEFDIFPYTIDKEGNIEECDLQIVPDNYSLVSESENINGKVRANLQQPSMVHQYTNVVVSIPATSREESDKTKEGDKPQITDLGKENYLNPFWLHFAMTKAWLMLGLSFAILLLGLFIVLLPSIYDCIQYKLLTL